MKKLFAIISALFILISVSYVYAKSAPKDLAAAIKREASKQHSPYGSSRVKTMCEEWPGCKDWVLTRAAEDPSFVIVDAEVERWLNNWERGEAVWLTRLYIQTRENSRIKTQLPQPVRIVTMMGNMENSQIKAYRFAPIRNKKDYTPQAPVEIKKFPGHPIKERPSTHAPYQIFITNVSLYKCNELESCKKLRQQKDAFVGKAVDGQYIYAYDEDGNALWARSLYVQFFYKYATTESFAFRTKQNEANGPYIDQPVRRITHCPYSPEFRFLK